MEVDHELILHVTQPTDPGVSRTVLDLVADQTDRQWPVAVASPEAPDFVAALLDRGARHLAWQATRAARPGSILEPWRLWKLLRVHRPTLVHLHSSKAGLAGRLAIRGALPTVFQPHAWSFEAFEGIARRAAIGWERLGARWADTVVCVSEGERLRGVQHGIRAQWRVIPNGVDAAPFASADHSAAREQLGVGDGPLVVCVGRLSRQKGQDVLLAAWPTVREAVPDAMLVLVGDGPAEGELRGQSTGSVTFAGRRDDVPSWLAAADVFVLPSRWEGLAYTILEAMAAGRSIVATDVAGNAEALGGEAGVLVPPEQPDPLAAAIVARLRDPDLREREGRAGRARATERFAVDRSTQAMAALYAELLNRRR